MTYNIVILKPQRSPMTCNIAILKPYELPMTYNIVISKPHELPTTYNIVILKSPARGGDLQQVQSDVRLVFQFHPLSKA